MLYSYLQVAAINEHSTISDESAGQNHNSPVVPLYNVIVFPAIWKTRYFLDFFVRNQRVSVTGLVFFFFDLKQ